MPLKFHCEIDGTFNWDPSGRAVHYKDQPKTQFDESENPM